MTRCEAATNYCFHASGGVFYVRLLQRVVDRGSADANRLGNKRGGAA